MITIGELARNAETTLRTIRYYEEQGLIPSSNEKRGNTRLYPDTTIHILKQIKILKEAGLSSVNYFLRETLTTVRNRIHKKQKLLEEIERSLATVVRKTAQCDVCETPNPEKDCRGCENLTALRNFGENSK